MNLASMEGASMLQLVFESETVEFLLLNAPGCCAGGKIVSAAEGGTNSLNARN